MTSSNHQSSADNNLALIAKLQSLPKAARNLLAGGLAGMIAKSFVAPIDRIKILYQVTSAQFRLRDVPRVAYSIIEKEGWAALWKGNTATMIRVFPYSGIQFMVFDYCKTHFLLKDKNKSEQRQKQQQVEHDVTKTAPDRTLSYADVAGKRSSGSANYNRHTTLHHRGTIDNPHNTTTTATQHDNKVKGGLSPIDSLISGMAAGSVSVLCTYPLDLARAQLAVLRRKKKPKDNVSGTTTSTSSSKLNLNKRLGIGSMKSSSKKGIGYVLSNGFEQGGIRGLYRGITPTLLGILPYSGTAFMINEQAKLRISHIMQREPTTIERLQCGALSGLFAQTLTYPLEVTRRRMQTIGIVPTSGSESASINFMGVSKIKPCVDELPSSATSSSSATTNPSITSSSSQVSSTTTATSASSSTTNATTTTPSQLKSTTAHRHKPPSMITTMAHLLEEQGLRGFFKGVSMNWIKGPVAFSISFTAFDTIQGWIEMESEKEERHRLTSRSSTKKMMERRMTNHLERRITNPQDED
ncbi:hypothetical protein ACHAWC_003097 [Mediolabrus comicus]